MENKKPLHEIIANDLFQKITSGVYQIDDMLPKEMELAQQYGVSRPTVRQAVQGLVNQGYLERKKRKGTYVTNSKINQEFTQVIESFDSEMGRKGLVPKTTVIVFKEVKANPEVAENLQMKEDERVYKLIRLRYAEDDPVVLVTSYLPKYMLPDFLDIDFTDKSLYGVLEEMNLRIEKIYRKLDVIKADETTGDLLEIDEGEPVFYFHSVGYTAEQKPVEYSISKYRGDMNSFVFTIANSN